MVYGKRQHCCSKPSLKKPFIHWGTQFHVDNAKSFFSSPDFDQCFWIFIFVIDGENIVNVMVIVATLVRQTYSSFTLWNIWLTNCRCCCFLLSFFFGLNSVLSACSQQILNVIFGVKMFVKCFDYSI